MTTTIVKNLSAHEREVFSQYCDNVRYRVWEQTSASTATIVAECDTMIEALCYVEEDASRWICEATV